MHRETLSFLGVGRRRIAPLLIALASMSATANAVDILVTTDADSGAGSLREAFTTAEAGDRIVFDIAAAAPTITVLTDLPAVNVDVSFANNNVDPVTIDRNGTTALMFLGDTVDPTVLVVNSFGGISPDADIISGAGTTVFGDGAIIGNVEVPGSIAPGSSADPGTVGTFDVTGNLDVSSAQVELDLSASNSVLSNDLINVDGVLDITDATVVPNFVGDGFEAGQSYLLLSSTNAITGTFVNQADTFVLSNYAFLEAIEDVSLQPNGFGLLIQDNGTSFTSFAEGCNQTSAATLLDELQAGGSPPASIADLRNGTVDEVTLAYNQLSGSIYPSLVGAEINHIQNNLESVRNRADFLFCSQPGEWMLTPWARGYGISAQVSEDDCRTLGYRQEVGGIELGCGLNFGCQFTAYTFAHLASGSLNLRGADQRAEVDSYRIGGLVGYLGHHAYLVAAGGAGTQDYSVRRSLSAFDGSTYARSSFDGNAEFGYFEVGTAYAGPWTPYMAMHTTRVELDPIMETGDPDFALRNDGVSGDSLRGILGVTLKVCGPVAVWQTTTRLRFGWMHEYLDTNQILVSQVANGGNPSPALVDRGVNAGRDWGFVRTQVDSGRIFGGQLTVAYEGQFNSRSSFNEVLAGMRWIY